MHEKILRKVGATRVMYPEVEMGRRVAKYIVADNFADWIEAVPEVQPGGNGNPVSLDRQKYPDAWNSRKVSSERSWY